MFFLPNKQNLFDFKVMKYKRKAWSCKGLRHELIHPVFSSFLYFRLLFQRNSQGPLCLYFVCTQSPLSCGNVSFPPPLISPSSKTKISKRKLRLYTTFSSAEFNEMSELLSEFSVQWFYKAAGFLILKQLYGHPDVNSLIFDTYL